jgi:cytochrome c1
MAALAFPAYVLAGGWAVVTLDNLPENVVAGQSYPVGLMVRQHGRTPWQADALTIEARQPQTGQKVTFTAKPDQTPGHYQVELLFPQPGRWEWGVQSGLYPKVQPMPGLLVQSGAPAAASAGSRVSPAGILARFGLPQILGGSALAAFAVGAVLVVRGRKQRLTRLVGIGSLILCAGLAAASFSVTRARVVSPAAEIPLTSPASTGQELFLAKGCVVCHINERAIKGSENYSVNMGPNLSAYHNDPAYLRQWLKDPSSLKPAAEMPNLELKAEEIDALVEFINSPAP